MEDVPPLELVTIPISHYCEKARWALERADIPYRERRHVQGIHRIAARRAGGGSTLPVLVTPEGSIGESREILEWVDERAPDELRLFPLEAGERAQVEALSDRFDEVLGPRARRLIYVHVLGDPKTAMPFNNAGVPAWEDRFMRVTFPLAKRWIENALGVRPGVEVGDEAAVFAEFDHVAELLADGRPYLCGERFTAADLTFAALSSAVTAPPQYGTRLPQPEELKPATAELIERAREHQAGQFALRMFATERVSGTGPDGRPG